MTRVVQAVCEPRLMRFGQHRSRRFRGLQLALPRRMKDFIVWMLGVPGGLIVLWSLANQIGC